MTLLLRGVASLNYEFKEDIYFLWNQQNNSYELLMF